MADSEGIRPLPMPTPPAALTALLALVALVALGLAAAAKPGSATPPRAYGGGAQQAEPDRPVTTTVQQAPYAVTGTSADAILASMAQAAPHADGQTFFGLTTTALSFRYRRTQEDGRCVLRDVRVDLSVSVQVPRWARPAGAPYDVARDWARFESALSRHEDRHRVLAAGGAEATHVALDRLEARTCEDADLAARRVADRISIETEAAHRRYDDETGHGATQGASWPLQP